MKRSDIVYLILGNAPKNSLAHKVMNITFLMLILVSICVSFFVPSSQMSPIFTYLLILTAIMSLFAFILSRFYQQFMIPLLISTFIELLLIFFDWKENGGVKGTIPLTFTVMLLVNLHLYPRKYHLHLSAFTFCYFGCIIYFEIHYPHWLTPSKIDTISASAHWAEMLLITFFTVYLFKKYDYKRQEKLIAKEKELLIALEKEKKLNLLKNKFVAMVSHQFRTPMTIIYSSAEILDITVKEHLPSQIRERSNKQFHKIYNAVSRITSMMEKVLNFGKMESQQIRFNPQKGDVTLFIKEIIDNYPVEENTIKIPLKIEGHIRAFTFDPLLLEHCLINLLNNAIHYDTEKRFPQVRILFQSEQAIISVRDQGLGIPQEEQSELFTPFFRAKNVENLKGTGIGLAVVKHFIELHQGEVSVKSQQGKGSTFKISLPLKVGFPHQNGIDLKIENNK